MPIKDGLTLQSLFSCIKKMKFRLVQTDRKRRVKLKCDLDALLAGKKNGYGHDPVTIMQEIYLRAMYTTLRCKPSNLSP